MFTFSKSHKTRPQPETCAATSVLVSGQNPISGELSVTFDAIGSQIPPLTCSALITTYGTFRLGKVLSTQEPVFPDCAKLGFHQRGGCGGRATPLFL